MTKMNEVEKKHWWKEEVIYQIYPKSFYDSNNDGIGDIKGITQKLDYLADLGITMLWICPIFSSPMVDNGYDISDYKGIQKEFGSMDELDELIEESEKRGIKIILDLVVNHTSHEHEWFKEAVSNPTSKYRDYYIFKEGIEDREPNNWRSIFGGSVWEKVPNEENMYYFHTFDKLQPDLNWENPYLREEIYEMINWWLEKGIAGFRIDSITFIKKDQDYKSVLSDGADNLASVKHKGRNRPGISDFLMELNEKTFKKYKCVTVGEAPGVDYNEFDQYIGNAGYFNMIFDFHYADIDVENGSEWFRQHDWDVKELRELIFTSQLAIQKHGWGANFLENHDQPRSISKYVKDAKYQNDIGGKALATLFFFLRGTPFIYQGQEIGMVNFNRSSIEDFDDISSIDNYHRALLEGYSGEDALKFVNMRSRDNGRTPMQWTSGSKAGFSQNNHLWLDLVGNQDVINVDRQLHDEKSLLNYYKKMIQLRNHSIYKETLIYGSFEPLESAEDVIAYARRGKDIIEVFINLSSNSQKIDTKGKLLLDTYSSEQSTIDGEYDLLPYQAVVIRKDEKNGQN